MLVICYMCVKLYICSNLYNYNYIAGISDIIVLPLPSCTHIVNICPEDGIVHGQCFREAQDFVYHTLESRYTHLSTH